VKLQAQVRVPASLLASCRAALAVCWPAAACSRHASSTHTQCKRGRDGEISRGSATRQQHALLAASCTAAMVVLASSSLQHTWQQLQHQHKMHQEPHCGAPVYVFVLSLQMLGPCWAAEYAVHWQQQLSPVAKVVRKCREREVQVQRDTWYVAHLQDSQCQATQNSRTCDKPSIGCACGRWIGSSSSAQWPRLSGNAGKGSPGKM
jgi:hypothetical protein